MAEYVPFLLSLCTTFANSEPTVSIVVIMSPLQTHKVGRIGEGRRFEPCIGHFLPLKVLVIMMKLICLNPAFDA